MRLLLHGPPGKRGAGECVFFLVHPLTQTIVAASVRLGRGPRHASAYGCPLENLLSFSLALFALGIWCIISVDFVPGSHCSGRLGVAVGYGKFDFTGDVFFRGCTALFHSGYMLCVSTFVALDVFSHISHVAADLISEALLLHSV